MALPPDVKPDWRRRETAVGVAVIIVNFNSGPLLGECLRHLRAQTQRPERVIVVDNASQDSSADPLERDYPEVEVVRLDRNLGFAAANNLAARWAEGVEWLALLNPDAFPEPDWLERLLAVAVTPVPMTPVSAPDWWMPMTPAGWTGLAMCTMSAVWRGGATTAGRWWTVKWRRGRFSLRARRRRCIVAWRFSRPVVLMRTTAS